MDLNVVEQDHLLEKKRFSITRLKQNEIMRAIATL